VDIRKVKKLIELLEESGISELEIKEGEESVRISRNSPPAIGHYAMPMPAAPAALAPIATASTGDDAAGKLPPGHKIESPMVGTYYEAAAPGSAPFVQIGQRIKAGDTLCIIEAMKILNQIESDVAGEVKAILAKNGDPVEYGQALFIIE
jgi:acetyl-CoA carboxylase biotin carboxyl carrier protein